jgi:hypothetical protein
MDGMKGLAAFVNSAEKVSRTLLNILNDQLGLPKGRLDTCHIGSEPSIAEVTIIRNPGVEEAAKFSEEQPPSVLIPILDPSSPLVFAP